jgi:hypothetical protein
MNALVRRRLALQIAATRAGVRLRRTGTLNEVETVVTAGKDAARAQLRRTRKTPHRAA